MLGYALMLVTADGLTSVTQPQLTVDLVCYADKGPPVDSKACRHDADVQVCRATANAGARSAACSPTTAYWSPLSDRWGRPPRNLPAGLDLQRGLFVVSHGPA